MAKKTTAELRAQGVQIRDEVVAGANTANRVGGAFVDFADSMGLYTTIPSGFVMPALGGNTTTLQCGNSEWMIAGEYVVVGDGVHVATMQVNNLPDSTHVVLNNPVGYGNPDPGVSIGVNAKVSPTGQQGATGNDVNSTGGPYLLDANRTILTTYSTWQPSDVLGWTPPDGDFQIRFGFYATGSTSGNASGPSGDVGYEVLAKRVSGQYQVVDITVAPGSIVDSVSNEGSNVPADWRHSLVLSSSLDPNPGKLMAFQASTLGADVTRWTIQVWVGTPVTL